MRRRLRLDETNSVELDGLRWSGQMTDKALSAPTLERDEPNSFFLQSSNLANHRSPIVSEACNRVCMRACVRVCVNVCVCECPVGC